MRERSVFAAAVDDDNVRRPSGDAVEARTYVAFLVLRQHQHGQRHAHAAATSVISAQ